MSYLLVGDRLNAVDLCATQAADWSFLWNLSLSSDTTPRGGVRQPRSSQQPRAAMLLWAEDKISREMQGLNTLTVRMLLRAEQRMVSAIYSRSPNQTREIMVAAYRRAGLMVMKLQHRQQTCMT